MEQHSNQNIKFLTRLTDSFYRHRWLFVLSVAIVIGLTVLTLQIRKPMYRATAQTEVVTDNTALANVLGDPGGQNTWVSPAQQNANRLTDMLEDDHPNTGFLDIALKAADLTPPINVDPTANDPRLTLLKKNLMVAQDSDNLFSITLTWPNPTECEHIVRAIQAEYIERVKENSENKQALTVSLLNSEMKKETIKMEQAEAELSKYRQEHAGQLPDAQANDIAQLATLRNQRDALERAVQGSALKKQGLQERLAQIKPDAPLTQTLTLGPDAQSLAAAQAKRNALIVDGYAEEAKEVTDLDHAIDVLKKKIAADSMGGKQETARVMTQNPEYQTLQQELTEANIAASGQQQELNDLDKQIANYQSLVASMPAAERALQDKIRDYDNNKDRYQKMLTRRDDALLEAKIDGVIAKSKLNTVGTVYAQPTTPRSKILIMGAGAVFVGLLIGVALVVFSEWTDPTLRYGADVERVLDVPLLCEAPEIRTLENQPPSSVRRLRGKE